MVELRLDTLDVDDNDTFVSVRVGEVQKLSKLTPSRHYRFDQAAVGDRKFGKVEIFRRVGSTSVSIKNASETELIQEVSVPLKDASPVTFNVAVNSRPEAQEKRRKAADKLKTRDGDSKVSQAKQYLVEHNLEERLAEAVQAVLREKPEDPSAFIGELLKKSAGDYKKLSTEPASSADVADVAAVPSQSSPAPAKPAAVDPAAIVAGEPAPAAAPASVPDTTQETHQLRKKAKEVLVEAAVTGSLVECLEVLIATKRPSAWNQKPSVGSWCAPLRKPPAISPKAPTTQETSQAELVRLQAKETILKASADGALLPALSSLSPANVLAAESPPAVKVLAEETQEANTTGQLLGDKPARAMVMLPTSLLYGPAFAGTPGLRPNFLCL